MAADYFGLYDTTVEVLAPPDIIQLAKARYNEARENADAASKEHLDMVDDLIAAGDYIALHNLEDASAIADQFMYAAGGDVDALYGDCECGIFGGVCRKCAANSRVMAWYRESRGSNGNCVSHNNIIANDGDELWTGE